MRTEKIGYVTTCPKVPVGGVMFLYQQVEMLREMGYDAYMVLEDPDFKPWWMIPPPNVKTASVEDQFDLWVIPECRTKYVETVEGKRVIFVQNAGLIRQPEVYRKLDAVMVVSDHVRDVVKTLKLGKPIYPIYPFYDPDLFSPHIEQKEPGTVLILRRKIGTTFAREISERLLAEGFKPVVVSKPIPQAELAGEYAKADYYIHLSYPEGFPMPPVEAMASGCVVCGFTGGGGKQTMKHLQTAYVVEDGDIDGILKGLLFLRDNPVIRERMRADGTEAVSAYTREQTKRRLSNFAETMMGDAKFDQYEKLMKRIIEIESEQAVEIGEILWDEFHPKSVIDLGCGPGIYLPPFRKHGAKVLGMDACTAGGEVLGDGEFVLADLTRPVDFPGKFELCICFEVGEHIPEGYAPVLVENCTRAADIVFWSAARVGQTGLDHINCQGLDYWIKWFELFGFVYDSDATQRLKKKMEGKPGIEQRKWLLWNGGLFRRYENVV